MAHLEAPTLAPRALHALAAPDLIRSPVQPRTESERACARIEAVWARHEEDVRAAQALRHRVFAGEMGARLQPAPGTPPGHDADLFDPFCEHLLVRTIGTDRHPSEVVGTYRVLTPDAARRIGGLYTDAEFDLVRLARLRPRMAELGRSCTDPQWRTGGVILMLWASLAQFMKRNGLDIMIGCASVPMRDGGRSAAALWRRLSASHLAPIEHRVTPRLPLPLPGEWESNGEEAVIPPLIKGYLACGARVLGAPAWDPDFGCADLPLMLRFEDVPAAYQRRFLSVAC